MRVLIVHRDADTARQFVDALRDDLQEDGDVLHDVDSLFAAICGTDYDVLLLDLVTLAGDVRAITDIETPAQITAYLCNHPDTRIVLHHTVGRGITEGVVQEVLAATPNARISLLDCLEGVNAIRESVLGYPVA